MIIHGYCDGACNPNPGKIGIGGTLLHNDKKLAEFSEKEGAGTSNMAEYLACIRLITYSLAYGGSILIVHTDSKLLVNQVNGAWVTNDPKLKPLRDEVLELTELFEQVQFIWIPRERNVRADRLSKQALLSKEPPF